MTSLLWSNVTSEKATEPGEEEKVYTTSVMGAGVPGASQDGNPGDSPETLLTQGAAQEKAGNSSEAVEAGKLRSKCVEAEIHLLFHVSRVSLGC